jgi:cell division protein FtsX
MFTRIISNTRKHIMRSGWIGWASAFVMTLAFLVVSIFGGLAYASNIYIKFIEEKSNMLVFFEVGMDKSVVNNLQAKWSMDSRIKSIDYLGEAEAYDFYYNYTSKAIPEYFSVLSKYEDKRLPSSLEIRLSSLNDLADIKKLVTEDIEKENQKLVILNLDQEMEEIDEDTAPLTTEELTETNETAENTTEDLVESPTSDIDINLNDQVLRYKFSDDPTEPPISLDVQDENLEKLKDVLFFVRIAGISVISLLFIVIALFIFMTVEFRLYNQKEEIGVMQLVGGSLFFIRAPYILEGALYGFMGALFSSAILGALLIWIFEINETSAITEFYYQNFANLPWPNIDLIGLAGLALVGVLAAIGAFLGAVSSYLSIRRYIR